MRRAQPADIEGYLARQPPAHAATVRELLRVLAEEFPALGFRLAWNVPHAVLGPAYVAGVSCARGHVAFSPWSRAALAAHRDRLGDLDATPNLIRVPPGWKVDRALIAGLVSARLAELAGGPAPRPGAAKGLPRRPRRPK